MALLLFEVFVIESLSRIRVLQMMED